MGAPVTVLVVDDQALVRAGFRALVDSDPGLEVVGEAADGEDALAVAAETRPDVVLMDIRMPKMDGIEVLKALKTQYPLSGIPVIMLSALLDEATKKACNYEYGEEYIEKPVDIEELKNRIEAVLRRTGRLAPPPDPR
jgi:YesN/AraC family two-component response regulator